MNILITGFTPFGGETINPSWEAIRVLAETGIIPVQIPTVFEESWKTLDRAIQKHSPTCVICTGQAEGRSKITVEKIAINYMDARIPDNGGNQPKAQSIDPSGPDGIFASLPVETMVEAVKAAGIPAAVSYSAGTYVCNYVFYMLRRRYPKLTAGFIHVPYSAEQVMEKPGALPFMSLEMITEGLQVALEALV